MMQKSLVVRLAWVLATLSVCCSARAQHPTAIQDLQLSAFGGVSPAFTGLSGGKNLSFTAGVDLALHTYLGMRPTLEVRGTYPFDKGNVDSQKDILGGLRLDYPIGHRWHPYADFLVGRGEMKYGTGYPFNGSDYDLTTTNVYSPGAGIDYDLTEHFGVKLDGQFQHWGTAPTPSGNVYAKVATAAIVYRFNFNRHPRR